MTLTADRLDPILQRKLKPCLQGFEWTAVLKRLDVARGKRPSAYERDDPAAQLRMLTEPWGELGYFFEADGNRTVSTEAQQLRAMRSRLSHQGDLGEWEVVRTYGFVYELLSALEDEEGALVAGVRGSVLLRYSLGEQNGCFAGRACGGASR